MTTVSGINWSIELLDQVYVHVMENAGRLTGTAPPYTAELDPYEKAGQLVCDVFPYCPAKLGYQMGQVLLDHHAYNVLAS